MASRNLTEIFILMRNNASQNRNMFNEQEISDRMALVECGESNALSRTSLPPLWANNLEEIQYLISRIKKKLKDLISMQEAHLLKPTLDDSKNQEQQIELLTRDITRVFGVAQRLIHQIKQQSLDSKNNQEQRLSYNVIASLASSLQELTTQFNLSQKSYLNKLKSREERSNLYFNAAPTLECNSSSSMLLETSDVDMHVDKEFELGHKFTQEEQQLMQIEDDYARIANERKEEIDKIVNSIADLNLLFKDLSHMIVDQGTVLDRIDYNIEQTQTQVKQAYQQLAKAERYQRNNRKMQCILILAPATLVLLLLLIAVKF